MTPVPSRAILALTLIALNLIFGLSVFFVSQSVQQIELGLKKQERVMTAERQTIRLLDAEWAYLTRPQRLEELIADRANAPIEQPVQMVDAQTPPPPVTKNIPEKSVKNAALSTPAPAPKIAMAAPKAKNSGEVKKITAHDQDDAPTSVEKVVIKDTNKDVPMISAIPKFAAKKPAEKKEAVIASHKVAKPILDDVYHPTKSARVYPTRMAQANIRPQGHIARPIIE